MTAKQSVKPLPPAINNDSLPHPKRYKKSPGYPEMMIQDGLPQSAATMDFNPDISTAKSNAAGLNLPCSISEEALDTHVLPTPLASNTRKRQTDSDGSRQQWAGIAKLPKMEVDQLRQTLESQLSLEVLLKHDELRVIDQEIAKCQVALEQLRRCSEIPFSGSSITVGSTSNNVPSASPSPWGVNDAAYARHYARWLLPDPLFDGGEPNPIMPHGACKTPIDGRTTRASWADTNGSSRSQRSGAGAKSHGLPNGYPPPKEKVGPMIIKRKSDGQPVKLVCLDCRRENFSSTQGFINHCRIAHNRSFASHDAAAVASGEPVEGGDTGVATAGRDEVPSTGPAGYVHPLIRSAHLSKSVPKTKTTTDSQAGQQDTVSTSGLGSPSSRTEFSSTERRSHVVDTPSNSLFKASPRTPHLSALMQSQGISLDLSNIVDDALTRTEMDDDNFEEDTPETPLQPENRGAQLSVQGNRLPTRTVLPPSQPPCPSSKKGTDRGGRGRRSPGALRPHPAPYTSPYSTQTTQVDSQHTQDNDVDMIEPNPVNFSPNTIESNQAPSLVSDDGDYEAHSETESLSPGSSEPENEGHAFDSIEVQDYDYGSGCSSASDATSHISGPAKHRPPNIPRTPTPSTVRKRRLSKLNSGSSEAAVCPHDQVGVEQKRVSFASPVASTQSKEDGGRKQRRR